MGQDVDAAEGLLEVSLLTAGWLQRESAPPATPCIPTASAEPAPTPPSPVRGSRPPWLVADTAIGGPERPDRIIYLDRFRIVSDETVEIAGAFVDGWMPGRSGLHIEIVELESNPATEIRIGTRKPLSLAEQSILREPAPPPTLAEQATAAGATLVTRDAAAEVIDLLRIVRAETLSRGIKDRVEAAILALGGMFDAEG